MGDRVRRSANARLAEKMAIDQARPPDWIADAFNYRRRSAWAIPSP
jgi:hypothetical protein